MLSVVCKKSNYAGIIARNLRTSNACKGYIVLVPEIGEDAQAVDAILKPNGLPAFNDITIEICMGAIGQQASTVEKTVADIEKRINKQEQVNIRSIFQELDRATEPLETTWGIAKALYLGNSTLIPTKSYMNIHDRARNARATKYSSPALYEIAKANAAEEKQKAALGKEEQRLIRKYVLEGKLNGLSLQPNQRTELNEILGNLGKERASFRNKVNMAIHSYRHIIEDYSIVRDFPSSMLEAIAANPSQSNNGPWKITLQTQIRDNFLKYCPDRTHRWNLWQADVRKASGQLDKSLENSTHLEKIRALRHRQANLLGYATFADMSMETKMVGSVQKLKQMFTDIAKQAGPAQATQMKELQDFASASGFQQKLDLYDIDYWERKYLLGKHKIDTQKIRAYFPLPHVMQNLFKLAENLLGLKIVERNDTEVWQPTVKYYDLYDCNDGNQLVGGFYLDCYSKENIHGKNNGWMVSMRNRNTAAAKKPLCALIFNFTPPKQQKPYLLSVEDLRMVFKTFGTALQHLLTKADYSDLAGLSNIEWDASQVVGQVMSNFLLDAQVLQSISSHYESGEAMPVEFAQAIKTLATSLSGHRLCRELYFADLDIELHQTKDFWLDVVKRIWPLYNCTPLDKKDAHPCSMVDIFSGDWAAAQFSHLYSKMIAADISAAFEQEPAKAQEVGKRFKETFLASGGTVPTEQVFRCFRGRDPSIEALLKSLNINNDSEKVGSI